jgi:FkbM family methyltransferase
MTPNIPQLSLLEPKLVCKNYFVSIIGGWFYYVLSNRFKWPWRVRLLLEILLQKLSINFNAHHQQTIILNSKEARITWPAINRSLPDGVIYQEFLKNNYAILQDLGLTDKSVIFDVGANIGTNSILYGLWNAQSGGIVHSFEPFSENFRFLAENITNCGLSHVVCHNFGFSDTPKQLFLGMPTAKQHQRYATSRYFIESGLFSVYATKTSANKKASLKGEQCLFATIDQFVEDKAVQRIDFIKIDTEGHELAVLKGGKNSLQKYKPIIQLEINSASLHMAEIDPEEITRWLRKVGYKLYTFENSLHPFKEESFSNGDLRQGLHVDYLIELYAIPE